MMDEKYAAEQLRECPFCGKRPDLDDQDTLYPSGVGWKWDEELQMRTYHRIGDVPRDQWCWVMHCPTNSGGCGAEVHGDSREEAITKWNRRAHADTLEENARLKERVALDDTEREYRRQSLANEIRETLKVRGHFAAARPSDLIGCVARAIESERDRANLAEAELAKLRQHAEAMYESLELALPCGCTAVAADNYRADFPEEK